MEKIVKARANKAKSRNSRRDSLDLQAIEALGGRGKEAIARRAQIQKEHLKRPGKTTRSYVCIAQPVLMYDFIHAFIFCNCHTLTCTVCMCMCMFVYIYVY